MFGPTSSFGGRPFGPGQGPKGRGKGPDLHGVSALAGSWRRGAPQPLGQKGAWPCTAGHGFAAQRPSESEDPPLFGSRPQPTFRDGSDAGWADHAMSSHMRLDHHGAATPHEDPLATHISHQESRLGPANRSAMPAVQSNAQIVSQMGPSALMPEWMPSSARGFGDSAHNGPPQIIPAQLGESAMPEMYDGSTTGADLHDVNISGHWELRDAATHEAVVVEFQHRLGEQTFSGVQQGAGPLQGIMHGRFLKWRVRDHVCTAVISADGHTLEDCRVFREGRAVPMKTNVEVSRFTAKRTKRPTIPGSMIPAGTQTGEAMPEQVVEWFYTLYHKEANHLAGAYELTARARQDLPGLPRDKYPMINSVADRFRGFIACAPQTHQDTTARAELNREINLLHKQKTAAVYLVDEIEKELKAVQERLHTALALRAQQGVDRDDPCGALCHYGSEEEVVNVYTERQTHSTPTGMVELRSDLREALKEAHLSVGQRDQEIRILKQELNNVRREHDIQAEHARESELRSNNFQARLEAKAKSKAQKAKGRVVAGMSKTDEMIKTVVFSSWLQVVKIKKEIHMLHLNTGLNFSKGSHRSTKQFCLNVWKTSAEDAKRAREEASKQRAKHEADRQQKMLMSYAAQFVGQYNLRLRQIVFAEWWRVYNDGKHERALEHTRRASFVEARPIHRSPDAAGKYQIIKSCDLSEGKLTSSRKIDQLAPGTCVDVVEVEKVAAGKLIRGRLENPRGWISLRSLEKQTRWAVEAEATVLTLYLPESVDGRQVLFPERTPGQFIVENKQLQDTAAGVPYRLSTNLNDQDQRVANFGQIVEGEMINGWLKVTVVEFGEQVQVGHPLLRAKLQAVGLESYMPALHNYGYDSVPDCQKLSKRKLKQSFGMSEDEIKRFFEAVRPAGGCGGGCVVS